jgi:hypothetical protein
MLRGPQTVGELKQRTERLHRFDALPQVAETLEGLARRELVVRLERRPGQKEERYAHLLGEDRPAEPPPAAENGTDRVGVIEQRLDRLEAAVEELRTLVNRYSAEP